MKKDKQTDIASYKLEHLMEVPGLRINVHYRPAGEIVHERHAHLTEAHRHEFYSLAVSGSGSSMQMIDFRFVDLPPKSLFLLAPWQIHLASDTDHLTDIYFISFTADFLPPGFPKLPVCMEAAITPSADEFREIWHICAQLLHEFRNRRALQQQVLQHYLAVLLTMFMHYLPEQDNSQLQPELLMRYQQLLEQHFMCWNSVGDYARALHVTANHLNDVVKQATGQTASALLAARRILEARRMLLHSTHSIKEIAWCLQFNEVTYFNRFFKQHTGQTPLAFRLGSREKYNYNPE